MVKKTQNTSRAKPEALNIRQYRSSLAKHFSAEIRRRSGLPSTEEEPDTFASAFAHNMESIKESRTRLHAIQQEIDTYKTQARDLIAKLQGA